MKSNHEIAWEIRNEVNVSRKPFNMDDVPNNLYKTLSPQCQKYLDQLPVIDANHLDFNNGEGFFTSFLDGKQQLYILSIGERKFFVDTQGFDYARYVGEITY